MTSNIIKQVLALCLSIAFCACTQEQITTRVEANNDTPVSFDMELGFESLPESTNDSKAKALLYDASNLSRGKYPRLSTNNNYLTHTFIFDGKTLIGYTLLDWEGQRSSNGEITLSCRKEQPVYEMKEVYGVTTLNKNKTIKLLKDKTYKFLGVMGDGHLELDMPNETYQQRQTYGPRLSFDPKDYGSIFAKGKLKNGEGCIPYVFHRDVKIVRENEVKVLAKDNPKMRVTPATPVIRFYVKNETERIITSEDILIELRGITPKFVLGVMRGLQSPGFQIYRGLRPNAENETYTDYKLPIADLQPGAEGTYYIPVVMVNGDPKNVDNIELEVKHTIQPENGYNYSISNIDHSQKELPIYYNSSYNAANNGRTNSDEMTRYWLNTEGRYNMHSIRMSIIQAPTTPSTDKDHSRPK